MFYRLEFMSLYALPSVKVAFSVASPLPMVKWVVVMVGSVTLEPESAP